MPGTMFDQVGAAPGSGGSFLRRLWSRRQQAAASGTTPAEAAAKMRDAWQRTTPTNRRALAVSAAVLLLGTSVGAFLALRPTPQPDFSTADLDSVFNYALLTDGFNDLPVEERMKLIGELVQRLRGMSAQDSMLLAAFASGIAGSARQQIEENVSRLAIDVWDKYAKQYDQVPEDQRDQFLDQTYVEFTKLIEAVSGQPRDVSDEERLAEGRRQAQRDARRMSNPDRRPGGEQLGRAFGFLNANVGGHASAQQRARGQQMLRDMGRRFRNQDIATGKPLPADGGN